MADFNKTRYKQEFNKENYKEIRFWFKKDQLTSAKDLANSHGYDTINAYAKVLLEKALAEESKEV